MISTWLLDNNDGKKLCYLDTQLLGYKEEKLLGYMVTYKKIKLVTGVLEYLQKSDSKEILGSVVTYKRDAWLLTYHKEKMIT